MSTTIDQQHFHAFNLQGKVEHQPFPSDNDIQNFHPDIGVCNKSGFALSGLTVLAD